MKEIDLLWFIYFIVHVLCFTLFSQDIEQSLIGEKKKEADVVDVRLENIKLKNKLKKKEMELKSKVSITCFDVNNNYIFYLKKIDTVKPAIKDTYRTKHCPYMAA